MGDGAAAKQASLDPERIASWLVGPEVVDDDGRVWSWHNPAHPGHPYAEAGGLWLSWAADALAPGDAAACRVMRWLERELVDDRIGRDGHGYAFDLGVVLRGMLCWWQRTGAAPNPTLRAGAARLCAAIVERRAVWPAAAERWSTGFGGHQCKLLLAIAAIECAGLLDVARARDVLIAELDHARVDAPIYLHAHAYALEAIAWAGRCDRLDLELERLAVIQRAHGGMPAWRSAVGVGIGPSRSDATAQAVRLWAWRDRTRWTEHIARGLAFLGRMTRDGAVRYDDESDDRNTWCTLFALQAHAFARGEAAIDRLW